MLHSLFNVGEGCTTWGVTSLLLFVSANTLSSYSPRDRESLLRGEAIIEEDHLTGNIVIRVMPKSRDDDESSECSDRGSSSYDKNDPSSNAYNSVTHASKSSTETDQQTGTYIFIFIFTFIFIFMYFRSVLNILNVL